jgi:hypothetical protein
VTRLLHVVFAAWLLLAFPLAQQQALLHGLHHATAPDDAGGPPPTPESCPDHSLFTPFAGAASTPSHDTPAIDACIVAAFAAAPRPAPQASPSPYHSRAPPAPPDLA